MKSTSDLADDCCPALFEPGQEREATEVLADRLRVLADPTRLRLLAVLYASAGWEACVCDLTDPIGLTQPTVSHHMRVLWEAGFVSRERRGQWVFYRLEPSMIEALRSALSLTAA